MFLLQNNLFLILYIIYSS